MTVLSVNTQLVFEQGLLTNPNDHELKLVYSDWLEDEGNIALANFMRAWAVEKWYPETRAWVIWYRENSVNSRPLAKIDDKIHLKLKGRYNFGPDSTSLRYLPDNQPWFNCAFYNSISDAFADLREAWILNYREEMQPRSSS